MLINKRGESFKYNGVHYTIGEQVFANKNSAYNGLHGIVKEIRTGKDKDTDNDAPDIYCDFQIPVIPSVIKKIEIAFDKPIDEIMLDSVIMAPDMIWTTLQPKIKPKIYAVITDWAVDCESGHDIELFSDYEAAKQNFITSLEGEIKSGCVQEWKDDSSLVEESTEDSYECWIYGRYVEQHFLIEIVQKSLEIKSSSFVEEIQKQYLQCKKDTEE